MSSDLVAGGPGTARARLELRHAVDRALERLLMVNAKLRNFLQLVVARLCATDGLGCSLQKYPAVLQALLALGQIEPPPICIRGESIRDPPSARPKPISMGLKQCPKMFLPLKHGDTVPGC